jgi:hypothetical protein
MYSVYILYVLYVSVCICTYHEYTISLLAGTAGWLWNLRPGSRTLPHFNTGLPIYLAARAQANAQREPPTAARIQPLRPGSTPDSHHLGQTSRPRRAASTLPLPRSERVTNPRAGDHRTSLPGGTPAVMQLMTGQEAWRSRPSQARPRNCSSPNQDSRRLGREPKTNLKSFDPELDQQSTTDSIHQSLSTIH